MYRQATGREPGVRWLGQVSREFPSLNNDIVSHYPWGHLLLGCLISLFFFFFKANLLKTLLLVLYALAQTCLLFVVLKFYRSTVRKELALNWKQGQQKVETVGSFCAWVQRERAPAVVGERSEGLDMQNWI